MLKETGQSQDDEGNPDLLMANLWPGEMPEGEKSLWDRLPTDRKKQAVMRLSALLARAPEAVPAGTRKLSAQSAAEMAQVAVQTFYSIEKRWRTSPSIGSLGINAPSEDNRRAESRAKQQVRNIVRRLLRKNPDWDAPHIYEAVKAEVGDEAAPPSFGTVLRLIRDMRHYFPTTGIFGRRIVFDSAGLDLVDDQGHRLRLCAAIDDETGVILGWDLAPDRSVLIGHRFAARHALHGRRARFDVAGGFDQTGFQDLDLTGGFHGMSYPEEIELRVLPKDVFNELSWPLEQPGLKILGVPKLGNRIMDVLGERVAGLWLGVGIREDEGVSYRTGRQVSMPVANITTFGRIGEAIANHNGQVLDAQKSLGGLAPTRSVIDSINSSLKALIDVIPLGD